jgi:hypothetical protein
MKVKIGIIEISDVTMDELDAIVSRYGDVIAAGDVVPRVPKNQNSDVPEVAAADTVLLQKLVEASEGVTTNDIGDLLGRRGKSARPALREWSKRIGLVSDENIEAFEEARVGTQRGLRLKASFRDLARHILERK